MTEVWRDIPGYGGHYQASSLGRIKSKARIVEKSFGGRMRPCHYSERILRPCPCDKWGHLNVHIGFDGKKLSARVHRLVLEAFVGPAPVGTEACHNDGVASNNKPGNLRWDTHANNNKDRLIHGTYRRGVKHHFAKLNDDNVRAIRADVRPLDAIASEYRISKAVASKVRRHELWRHVDA